MDKKGELVTLGIIIAFLLISSFIVVDKVFLEKKYSVVNYAGDTSTHIVYNLKSNNPNCRVNEILIDKKDLMLFENKEEIPSEFTIDLNCY